MIILKETKNRSLKLSKKRSRLVYSTKSFSKKLNTYRLITKNSQLHARLSCTLTDKSMQVNLTDRRNTSNILPDLIKRHQFCDVQKNRQYNRQLPVFLLFLQMVGYASGKRKCLIGFGLSVIFFIPSPKLSIDSTRVFSLRMQKRN